MKNKLPLLLDLPKAMFNENQIDFKLIGNAIKKTTGRPSQFTKKICGLIDKNIPKKHEDRIKKIANNLENKNFRKEWYLLDNDRQFRDKNWLTFYKMMNIYSSKQDSFFLKDDKEYDSLFYKSISNKEFLNIDKLALLIENAKDQDANIKWLAINLWTHAEVGKWSALKKTIDYYEKYLIFFEENIKISYVKKLFDAISPVGSTRKDSHRIEKINAKNTELSINKETILGEESINSVEEINKKAIQEVGVFIEKLEKTRKNFYELDIPNIKKSISKIESIKKSFEDKMESHNKIISSRLNDIQKYFFDDVLFSYPVSKKIPVSIQEWIKNEKKIHNDILILESHSDDIKKSALRREYLEEFFISKDNIKCFKDFFSYSIECHEQLKQDMEKNKRLEEVLSNIKTSLEEKSFLNILRENNLSIFLNDFKYIERLDPILQGSLFRYYLDEKIIPYSDLIEYILYLSKNNYKLIISIISVISTTHVENIWNKNKEIQPWIQFSLIAIFYTNDKYNENNLSEIWYSKPLIEFTTKNHQAKNNISKLFSLLYYLFESENIKNINRLHDFVKNFSKSGKEDLENIKKEFNNKFIELSHPKNVYGKITLYAHNEIFNKIDEGFVSNSHEYINSVYESILDCYNIDKLFKYCIDSSGVLGVKRNNSEIKKHLHKYISERLDFINKIIKYKKNSKSVPEKEKKFISLVKNINRSSKINLEKEIYKFVFSENIKYKRSICYSRSHNNKFIEFLSSVFQFSFPIKYWRCVESFSREKDISLEIYLLDALENWIRPINLNSQFDRWKDEKNIEALSFSCKKDSSILFSNKSNVADYVKKEESKLTKKFERKIKEISAKSTNLSSDNSAFITEELALSKIQLDNKEWRELTKTIDELDELLCSLLSDLGDENDRSKLYSKIESLGGEIQTGLSLVELEKQYKKILEDTKNRREHLSFIYAIRDNSKINKNIKDKIDSSIHQIEHIKFLPTEEMSEYLAALFEGILDHPVTIITHPEEYSEKYILFIGKFINAILNIIFSKKWIAAENTDEKEILENIDSIISSKKNFESYKHAYSKIEKKLPEYIDKDYENDRNIGTKKYIKPPYENTNEKIKKVDEGTSNNVENSLTYITNNLEKLISKTISPDKLVDKDPLEIIYTNDWSNILDVTLSRYSILKKDDKLSNHEITSMSLSILLSNKFKDKQSKLFLATYTLTENTKQPAKVSKKIKTLYARFFIASVLSYKEDFLKNQEILTFDQTVEKLYKKENQKRAIAWLTKILGKKAQDENNYKNSYLLDALWGLALNQKKSGADYRAWIMLMCQKGALYGALSLLLHRDPNKLPKRRAELASQLFRSSRENTDNQLRMEKFLIAEKNKFHSKPFSIFVDKILLTQSEQANEKTSIQLVERLSATCIEKMLWSGVIEINPALSDPPMDIVLKVSPQAGVLFDKEKKGAIKMEGPFLKSTLTPIELFISKEVKDIARIEVVCTVKTLQERNYEHTEVWSIDLSEDSVEFKKPSNEIIESCFNHFPSKPMRGDNYVPRDKDEKSIEEIIFNSTQAESLWITSPRRSGKTTMLYRILDEFSYRKGKGECGDIVLYFTLAKRFSEQKEFNTFIFNRIKDRENRGISKYIGEIGDIKSSLDFSSDIDIFLEDLTVEILSRYSTANARVYYVIDEIDKFAEMYIKGGDEREKAKEMMWQLRHFISNQNKAGIVFSGSHVAKSFFVEDTSSPFYNSIKSISLTPFNLKTNKSSDRTKQILQPKSLTDSFQISKDVMNHFLWITAGIPYYMKLLAGATFVEATHSQIFEADINEGLRKMLRKETGLRNIDTLENPGADELRTLYTKTTDERILINATLLSLAEIKSPVSRIGVNKGELWSQNSRIFVEFAIQKELIEKALSQALDMGVLRPSKNSLYQIEFSIPMLGESLRIRSHSLWAEMSRKLEKISKKYEKEEL